ncbi:hypothetical protein A1O3_07322 [Capronia epimyces CBS 606.96]|uniref:Core domain-containing protein n=1 Tax=Capronia epimyces CBS 606.96 TaxID=1182542 RepID=W9YFF5_9EURO|nr:uncharacterized protein A1O3_07322 [Capronia epimyces CBS 606.96]EXJ81034.1 hypothetical protein A1O3_07322 [Capronia epimyces CBS 606.96]
MSQSPLRLAFRAAQPFRRQSDRDARSYFQACRTQTRTICRGPDLMQRTKRHANVPLAPYPYPYVTRSMSNTRTLQATVVLRNPRADDDGKEMTIEISDRAAKRLKQITTAPPQRNTLASSPTTPQDSHLRVTVTSGGCHGFQYLMSLEDASKIDPEEDTVFAASEETEGGQAKVVMDQPSLELLQGSTVDFTTELIGSQFKIVGNPRATSSCGCGTSFDIE